MDDGTVLKEILATLREIGERQRQQEARDAEWIKLQRDHYELARGQFERAQALQDKAETLQAKSSALVDKGRQVMSIVLPMIVLLIAYLTWLLFRA